MDLPRHAATLREKLQIKLAIPVAAYWQGQTVSVPTLQHQAPGRVATRVPVFRSLVRLDPDKSLWAKRGLNRSLSLSRQTPYRQQRVKGTHWGQRQLLGDWRCTGDQCPERSCPLHKWRHIADASCKNRHCSSTITYMIILMHIHKHAHTNTQIYTNTHFLTSRIWHVW